MDLPHAGGSTTVKNALRNRPERMVYGANRPQVEPLGTTSRRAYGAGRRGVAPGGSPIPARAGEKTECVPMRR
jgi:hypothetical protein